MLRILLGRARTGKSARVLEEIRAFFNQVRQEFLDWHGTVYGTPEFAAQETKLTDLYRSKVTG